MIRGAGQFARFCAVGAIGFIVDSSLTLLLVGSGLAAPLSARISAFVVAASVTWLLNRSFTFQSRSAGIARWLLYIALTAVGAVLNVVVYAVWVKHFGSTPWHLMLGIVWGSLLALGFNFAISKYIVFQARPDTI